MNGIDKFIEEAKDYGTNPHVQKEILRNVVTAEILNTMKHLNIKKADLAKLLNTSPPNITQMLNGNRNLTLDSLCEIALILGKKVQVTFVSDYTDEEIKNMSGSKRS
ncbi:MAG: XRE family transcriptional regulator [Spirochaetales bacterium]|jgi:transcriptional regulator with XRE-family HTH domain|nr:XRE family transcriptional regulator [Spirochaetales bacterium]